MKRFPTTALSRQLALAVATIAAALALWSVIPAAAPAAALPTASAVPAPSPASQWWTDPFTATMTVSPSATSLLPGDLLTVTVSIEVAEGCMYPVYELGLVDLDNPEPIFAYVDPPDDLVGPPVFMPFSFVLRAERPGIATLQGRAYGERNCNDFWNWTYVTGSAEPVRVGGWPYRALLPAVARGLAAPR